ncbi:MAG: S41 family peptidase [Planctomycetota bacterium]
MRRRILAAGFSALLAVWALFSVAQAQTGSTIVINDRSAQISQVIEQGQALESQRRWAEALTYYEEAVRQFPGDDALRRRFELARAHYDLGRRYADRSFRSLLGELTFDRALDVYAQVLLKIQSHYVDVPHWKELVDHGARGLEVALSEPSFVEEHVPAAHREAIPAFCSELHAALHPQVIVSRSSARDAVAYAGDLAWRRLQISPTIVALEFVCGAANALDNYSAYLTPDQLSEVYSQIEGNFVGLGVELKVQNRALVLLRVISGSPAELAGLKRGDTIIAVDGRPTAEMSGDQAANMLQGAEGTTAQLTVVSEGQTPRDVCVCRRRVEVPSVDRVQIVDPGYGVAYLRLTCFQKTTCRDLDAALWRLHGEGMRSLIIDLRGNPGGLLLSSVEAADMFLERGTIVSTRGRNTQEDFVYSARSEGTWRVPLVVLIDQESASAAEIFAGAIRDHDRGSVVGVRSFGKGSVQGIFPLDIGTAGVRLTTAKFYSPLGRPYSHVGVDPNVQVHTAARPTDGELRAPEDNMLAAAVETARHQPMPK